MDYIIHFALESIGGMIGVYSYRFCKHRWHRWVVWLSLTALTTIVTVRAVG
jgi:hypothetical protein